MTTLLSSYTQMLLLSVCWWLFVVDCSVVTNAKLSSSSSGSNSMTLQRQLVENLLLLQSERSRTGLRDPNHWIDYDNHPYDAHDDTTIIDEKSSQRGLQEEKPGGVFEPFRIHADTTALEALEDDAASSRTTRLLINFLKRKILPDTIQVWSDALSVIPVSGNLTISSSELDQRAFCGDPSFTEVPEEHLTQGVPNTDLILYVSGSINPSIYCPSTGSGLEETVVAVPCNFDQFDRPTAGALHFCLNYMLADSETIDEIINEDHSTADRTTFFKDLVRHHTARILGMGSFHFRFFWDSETMRPRTARPFSPRTVTCVDGTSRNLILPDANTLSFATTNSSGGTPYASIVTPKVRAIVRNQFNCQSLEGARLENQSRKPQDQSSSCTGEYWEERIFSSELLTGVLSRASAGRSSNIISALTLALMEDSGWYKANYSTAEPNTWGLGAGCDFVDGPCLVANGNPPEIPESSRGYFCNDPSIRSCSPIGAMTHKGACNAIEYTFIRPEEQYQYFPSNPSRGGSPLADYCPLSDSKYGVHELDNLDCRNSAIMRTIPINLYSEEYGSESKCFETDSGEGRCYRATCVKEDMTLRLNLHGEWLTCEHDFQELSVAVIGGGILSMTVTCPRLASACPNLFCPSNCAGRGICNYGNANETISPKCQCFDESDISPDCTNSLLADTATPSPNSQGNPASTDQRTQEPSNSPSIKIPSEIFNQPLPPSLEQTQTDSPMASPSMKPSTTLGEIVVPIMESNATSPSTLAASLMPSFTPTHDGSTMPSGSFILSGVPSWAPWSAPSVRPSMNPSLTTTSASISSSLWRTPLLATILSLLTMLW